MACVDIHKSLRCVYSVAKLLLFFYGDNIAGTVYAPWLQPHKGVYGVLGTLMHMKP